MTDQFSHEAEGQKVQVMAKKIARNTAPDIEAYNPRVYSGREKNIILHGLDNAPKKRPSLYELEQQLKYALEARRVYDPVAQLRKLWEKINDKPLTKPVTKKRLKGMD